MRYHPRRPPSAITAGIVMLLLYITAISFSCAYRFPASFSIGGGDLRRGSTEERMHSLNGRFQQTYEKLKRRQVDRILVERRQVIIVDEYSDLLTYHAGPACSHGHAQTTATYDALKTLAHMPAALTLSISLHNGGYGPVSPSLQENLISLRSDLDVLRTLDLVDHRNGSSRLFGSKKALNRQQDMVDETIRVLDGILNKRWVSAHKIKEYSSRMAVRMMKNADDAANTQIGWFWHNVMEFQRKCNVTRDDLHKDYIVLLMGPMLPSRRNLQKQFFERILRVQAEQARDRIIFVQNVQDEKAAALIAATSLQDRLLSLQFFDQEWRLHEDVLSEGAEKALNKWDTQHSMRSPYSPGNDNRVNTHACPFVNG